jgi:hypothetical protein
MYYQYQKDCARYSVIPNKGVIHLVADDSRLGGRCYRTISPLLSQLLGSVMTFYINLLTIDHSKMASDIRWFVSSIFAILAKALINTNCKLEFYHNSNIKRSRVWSGFSRVHRPIYFKKTGLE